MAGKAGRAGAIAEGTVDRPRDVGIAKKRFLEAFASRTVAAAMATVGRSEETYKEWRRTDESFRAQADAVREARMLGDARRPLPDFETFCSEYLHQPLEWHQMQWVDVLEGREPRDLHYSQQWHPGYSNRVLINVPPEHGKSTTLTMNWVTYQIVKNPNIRIILVSKNQKMAKQFLWGIKSRLTGPRFRALQAAFGPTDGFAKTADQWSADQIYLGEKDDGEKDPTIQALGMGGQIYGARADIVLVDDAVLLSNAHDYEQQARWLTQEVLTRLGREGVLAVVGTRVAPTDLYKHLVAEFPGVWSHLASPAILEDNEDPALIKTLWPERWDMAAEPPVRVPQWDGPSMVRRRQEVPASTWSLAYMQADVVEDAIFPEAAVLACLNRQRMAGIMVPGAPGHRREGMVGLYVVCSMDPALSGSTATVAYGVDAATGKRWVLDLHNEAGMTPASIRQHIYAWTEKYQPREWRIEKNAMQGMLTQDEELRAHLSGRGCRLIEHFTGSCVPDDVEILTAEGWKHNSELRDGELVASAEGFTPLLGINRFAAPEKMAHFTGMIECDFTENHRHLVEWRGNSRRERRMVATRDLKTNTPVIVTAEPHAPSTAGRFGLALSALLGWYLAEGSLKSGGGVDIGQRREVNAAKYQEIVGHLDTLGWKHKDTWDRIYVWKSDAENLTRLAPGRKKLLDLSVIAQMTVAERQAFLDALIDGDGSRSGGGITFTNTNTHILDAFEMAAALNGWTTRRSARTAETNFKATKVCYSVNVRKTSLTHPVAHDGIVTVEGEGQVWCPTTGSGTWIARSRGTTFVTGNSKWDADYGVASMAPLFLAGLGVDGKPNGLGLIDIPYNRTNRGSAFADQLVHQLVSWRPKDPGVRSRPGTTDMVMALWFADIRAQELMAGRRARASHLPNQFLSRSAKAGRVVVNLDDWMAQSLVDSRTAV